MVQQLHYTETATDHELSQYYYLTMDELLNPETDEGLTVLYVCMISVTRAWFNQGLSFWYRIAKIRRGKESSRVLVSPKCSRAAENCFAGRILPTCSSLWPRSIELVSKWPKGMVFYQYLRDFDSLHDNRKKSYFKKSCFRRFFYFEHCSACHWAVTISYSRYKLSLHFYLIRYTKTTLCYILKFYNGRKIITYHPVFAFWEVRAKCDASIIFRRTLSC